MKVLDDSSIPCEVHMYPSFGPTPSAVVKWKGGDAVMAVETLIVLHGDQPPEEVWLYLNDNIEILWRFAQFFYPQTGVV